MPDESVLPEYHTLVDAKCCEFEKAWRSAAPVRIEALLEDVPTEVASELFRKLLLSELELRGDREAHSLLSEFNGRFPTQRKIIAEVLALQTAHWRRRDVEASTVDKPPKKAEIAQANTTDCRQLIGQSSSKMQIRCPSCHTPFEVAVDTLVTDLTCNSCGSLFSLVDPNLDNQHAATLSMIGRFEVVGRLGVGSFGSVWKARDKELDRTVAIKIPRQGGMTAEEQEKFLREARAAAQLRHPHIVSVHEVGRDGDSVYIVSDFVPGVTLGDWLTGQRPSNREAAQLCATIADALDHAHERGIVHRDLKPANIMIDGDGEPHLMDFGLARRDGGEVTVTIDGQVLGTPAYMSPEQAQGESHQADRRSDVYSLGVILFQLLTGELPFRGNVRMIMHQVIHDDPPSPRKLNGQVPKDLETICLKCMEKDSRKRYATSLNVADDLGRFLSGRPITARPVGRLEHLRRWCVRNPVYAALSLSIVVVSLLGFTGVTWQLQKTLQAEQDRTLAEVNNLATAAPESVPEKVRTLDLNDRVVMATLNRLVLDGDSQSRLRACVAMLPAEPSRVTEVQRGLLQAGPGEFVALRRVLESLESTAISGLNDALEHNEIARRKLLDDSALPDERLNAAAMLRDSPDFETHVDFVVGHLLHKSVNDPQAIPYYLEMFRGASPQLTTALEHVFADASTPESECTISALFLAEYLANDLPRLTSLVVRSSPEQFPLLMKAILRKPAGDVQKSFSEFIAQRWPLDDAELKGPADASSIIPARAYITDDQATQVANAAIALVHLGSRKQAFGLLAHGSDPSVQSHLIDRFAKLDVPPSVLNESLRSEPDVAVRYALLLGLTGYSTSDILRTAVDFPNAICEIYQTDPDPGVHSAARLLLRRIALNDRVRQLDEKLQKKKVDGGQWHVNSALQTMVELTITEQNDHTHPSQTHRFAISTTEVTVEQLLKKSTPWLNWSYRPSAQDCPAIRISWSEAASYCNWLSQREQIPEDEWCYEKVGTDNGHDLLAAKPVAVSLHGYRLPTANEWEFACRAGTQTDRYFGNGTSLMSQYAWWGPSTGDGRVRPVASKKPNPYGMFDMYGNVIEWCHDEPPTDARLRLLRGMGAGDLEPDRSQPAPPGDAGLHNNTEIAGGTGFRVARTLE